jgi:hypothetical protein
MVRCVIPLGGWFNERLARRKDEWKANMKVIRATIDFFNATGRVQVNLEKGGVPRKQS